MAENEKNGRLIAGEEARQGEIILRSRKRRIIFIAGLAGFVLLAAIGYAVA